MGNNKTSNETIKEIKSKFALVEKDSLEALIKEYSQDERAGVKLICKSYENKLSKLADELERLEKMKEFEYKYSDYEFICGVDEVGRGPLAGPVMAGAVILPKDCEILYINDSKKLSPKKRDELYDEIITKALAFSVSSISSDRIDMIGINAAVQEAMESSINKLSIKPDILLNDAVTLRNINIKQVPIIQGDEKSVSIAAASIVAKVTRDRFMIAYDKLYPGYNFAGHKGYGTKEHTEALIKLGPTPVHRKSFIRNIINQ